MSRLLYLNFHLKNFLSYEVVSQEKYCEIPERILVTRGQLVKSLQYYSTVSWFEVYSRPRIFGLDVRSYGGPGVHPLKLLWSLNRSLGPPSPYLPHETDYCRS